MLPASAITYNEFVSPFYPHNNFKYKVTIPTSEPFVLFCKNDIDFLFQFIVIMNKYSPLKKGCKNNFQTKIWIAAINEEKKINITRNIEFI